jgi:glyoxylate reductase
MAQSPKLLVTRKLPEPVELRIARDYDAQLNRDDTILTRAELLAHAQGCSAILTAPGDSFDAVLIAELPDTVRMIATFSVGYDHIDTQALKSRAIRASNTPDVLTDATADIAMLLLLGAARGAGWGEAMIRQDNWQTWRATGPLGFDVTGRRLGIYGMGRIGRAVARRARGFDLEIHYHNRQRLASGDEDGAVFHDTLDGLMPVSDFLSINCASTSDTRGSIDAAHIALLPVNAIIVNSARGDIIDDDALIAALETGRVAAAGLDVFANEPNLDARYRGLENTFLLPHLGSSTFDTRVAMGMRALDNLDAFFAGDSLPDPIA